MFAIGLLLCLLLKGASGHEKDEECFASTGEPTLTTLLTTRTTTPSVYKTTTPTNLSRTTGMSMSVQTQMRAVGAVDLTHKYIDSYGTEVIKSQRRVILNNGEPTVENYYAQSHTEFNPRNLMLEFDGIVVTLVTGKYREFYNSVTVTTDREWTCERRSLSFGSTGTITFSENCSYRGDTTSCTKDIISMQVLTEVQPHGNKEDLECFDIMFPQLTKGNHISDLFRIKNSVLNVTQGYYEQVNSGKWCCNDYLKETLLLKFDENEQKVIKINYKPSSAGGFSLENKNPRNLTILYKEGRFLIGMAKLYNSKSATPGSGSGWKDDEKWTCDESSFELDADDPDVHKLEFYTGVMSHGSYVRRDGYLYLSSPASGTGNSARMKAPLGTSLLGVASAIGLAWLRH